MEGMKRMKGREEKEGMIGIILKRWVVKTRLRKGRKGKERKENDGVDR